MNPGAKRLTDSTELRAIAHPLRNRLLTELYARREGSATTLAEALDEPINRVSFHLRLLAKYGFIVEAPELARDGRDRWWRPAYQDGLDWDYLAANQPGLTWEGLNHGLNRSLLEIKKYFSQMNEKLEEWPKGSFSHDWYLMLTQDEAAKFDEEYLDLCRRWRDDVSVKLSTGQTEDRKSYAIFIYGFPHSET